MGMRVHRADTDADLVEALRGADPEGAARLLERHGDRVYRLALRVTGVPEEAAQAVEDTLRTAVLMIYTLTGTSPFESWIDRIAAKRAYQRLRARQPHIAEIVFDDVVPPLDGAGRHFASMDDWS